MVLWVALWLLLRIIWWSFNFRCSTKIKPGCSYTITIEPLLRGLGWNFSFYYSVKANSSSVSCSGSWWLFNFATPRKLNTAAVVDRISVLPLRRNLIPIMCIALNGI